VRDSGTRIRERLEQTLARGEEAPLPSCKVGASFLFYPRISSCRDSGVAARRAGTPASPRAGSATPPGSCAPHDQLPPPRRRPRARRTPRRAQRRALSRVEDTRLRSNRLGRGSAIGTDLVSSNGGPGPDVPTGDYLDAVTGWLSCGGRKGPAAHAAAVLCEWHRTAPPTGLRPPESVQARAHAVAHLRRVNVSAGSRLEPATPRWSESRPRLMRAADAPNRVSV
jgi:hypothetical protein